MASSLALAFSVLAMRATDFGPRTWPPQWWQISSAIGTDSFHKLSQSSFVFQVNLCEGDGGAGLPVDQMPQLGLSLDNALENPHLLAQGQQEDSQLDGIHTVCNHF